MTSRSMLLASTAMMFLASSAFAQDAAPAPTQQPANAAIAQEGTGAAQAVYDDYGDEEPIVIQGTRARGSVIGDIPPQNILDSRDVRATGATNINDLLEALAPQIGSSQGRGGERPVLLLNGQRISSFRELRDIPPEAIERVEILPEEVALKYGYRADQKVVNIVLRQRFRSTTAQVGGTVPTEGGYAAGNADLTQFRVERNGRTTLNAHAEGNGMLTEAERDILIDPPASGTTEQALAARSLLGTKRDLRTSGTFNRQILGDVSATLNTEVEHNEGRSLIGLGETLLVPLARETSADTAHAGGVLNGTKGDWRWTLTGNADLERSRTDTDRDDPDTPHDHARETTRSGDLKATANGKLFSLPAGDATTTLTLAGSTVHLDSDRSFLGGTSSTSLGRTTGDAAMNIDLPISRRNRDFSALGNLTLNANAEVDHLSDFGALTTMGAGANWSPVDRVSFITSWSREEGPPTINQLGDAVLVTPGTRIFDFTTGETVLVTAITGGNPDLDADRRNVTKIGINWQPFAETDLRLRGEYVHQTIDRPITGLNVTPTIEEAFPERFIRDASGQLVSADLRPVNFESSRRGTLRIGFDFSKPLKSRQPSQAVRDQLRAQFGGRPRGDRSERGEGQATTPAPSGAQPQGEAAAPPGSQPAAPPATGAPAGEQGGSRGGRGFGARGGGGPFGGRDRGRLTFSLTDTITFVDEVKIREGFPEIDYLHGDAAGQGGGTPRHQVEARAGYFNNGLGARLNADWRSGTTVDTLTGDNLHFSPLATFDLRLFANPGDIPEIAVKHPWLRGTQVQLRVDNIFNSRPKVHDSNGEVPLSYQPDLLDPLGRTIMISFRKLFLPSPSWFRRQFQEMRQQQSR
jgi:opacity protein-like surface antigen